MSQLPRRSFLKASTGLALVAGSTARAELPVPPALGRTHHDPPARRRVLYDLLGDLPDRQRPISAHKRDEQPRDGYVLETWELDLNGLEPVPALLAKPTTFSLPDACRLSLFNHSHGGGYDDRQARVRRRAPLPSAPSLCQGADHRRGS